MVTDLGHIDGINGLDFVTGAPTLHISAESVGESAVFVGVGPTADVERYLDGVETETVTKVEREDAKDTTTKEKSKTKNAEPQFRVTSIKTLAERCE